MLSCIFSLDLSEDIVLTSCKHHFCRKCLDSLLSSKGSAACPICKSPITKRNLHNKVSLSSILCRGARIVSACENDLARSENCDCLEILSGAIRNECRKQNTEQGANEVGAGDTNDNQATITTQSATESTFPDMGFGKSDNVKVLRQFGRAKKKETPRAAVIMYSPPSTCVADENLLSRMGQKQSIKMTELTREPDENQLEPTSVETSSKVNSLAQEERPVVQDISACQAEGPEIVGRRSSKAVKDKTAQEPASKDVFSRTDGFLEGFVIRSGLRKPVSPREMPQPTCSSSGATTSDAQVPGQKEMAKRVPVYRRTSLPARLGKTKAPHARSHSLPGSKTRMEKGGIGSISGSSTVPFTKPGEESLDPFVFQLSQRSPQKSKGRQRKLKKSSATGRANSKSYASSKPEDNRRWLKNDTLVIDTYTSEENNSIVDARKSEPTSIAVERKSGKRVQFADANISDSDEPLTGLKRKRAARKTKLQLETAVQGKGTSMDQAILQPIPGETKKAGRKRKEDSSLSSAAKSTFSQECRLLSSALSPANKHKLDVESAKSVPIPKTGPDEQANQEKSIVNESSDIESDEEADNVESGMKYRRIDGEAETELAPKSDYHTVDDTNREKPAVLITPFEGKANANAMEVDTVRPEVAAVFGENANIPRSGVTENSAKVQSERSQYVDSLEVAQTNNNHIQNTIVDEPEQQSADICFDGHRERSEQEELDAMVNEMLDERPEQLSQLFGESCAEDMPGDEEPSRNVNFADDYGLALEQNKPTRSNVALNTSFSATEQFPLDIQAVLEIPDDPKVPILIVPSDEVDWNRTLVITQPSLSPDQIARINHCLRSGMHAVGKVLQNLSQHKAVTLASDRVAIAEPLIENLAPADNVLLETDSLVVGTPHAFQDKPASTRLVNFQPISIPDTVPPPSTFLSPGSEQTATPESVVTPGNDQETAKDSEGWKSPSLVRTYLSRKSPALTAAKINGLGRHTTDKTRQDGTIDDHPPKTLAGRPQGVVPGDYTANKMPSESGPVPNGNSEQVESTTKVRTPTTVADNSEARVSTVTDSLDKNMGNSGAQDAQDAGVNLLQHRDEEHVVAETEVQACAQANDDVDFTPLSPGDLVVAELERSLQQDKRKAFMNQLTVDRTQPPGSATREPYDIPLASRISAVQFDAGTAVSADKQEPARVVMDDANSVDSDDLFHSREPGAPAALKASCSNALTASKLIDFSAIVTVDDEAESQNGTLVRQPEVKGTSASPRHNRQRPGGPMIDTVPKKSLPPVRDTLQQSNLNSGNQMPAVSPRKCDLDPNARPSAQHVSAQDVLVHNGESESNEIPTPKRMLLERSLAELHERVNWIERELSNSVRRKLNVNAKQDRIAQQNVRAASPIRNMDTATTVTLAATNTIASVATKVTKSLASVAAVPPTDNMAFMDDSLAQALCRSMECEPSPRESESILMPLAASSSVGHIQTSNVTSTMSRPRVAAGTSLKGHQGLPKMVAVTNTTAAYGKEGITATVPPVVSQKSQSLAWSPTPRQEAVDAVTEVDRECGGWSPTPEQGLQMVVSSTTPVSTRHPEGGAAKPTSCAPATQRQRTVVPSPVSGLSKTNGNIAVTTLKTLPSVAAMTTVQVMPMAVSQTNISPLADAASKLSIAHTSRDMAAPISSQMAQAPSTGSNTTSFTTTPRRPVCSTTTHHSTRLPSTSDMHSSVAHKNTHESSTPDGNVAATTAKSRLPNESLQTRGLNLKESSLQQTKESGNSRIQKLNHVADKQAASIESLASENQQTVSIVCTGLNKSEMQRVTEFCSFFSQKGRKVIFSKRFQPSETTHVIVKPDLSAGNAWACERTLKYFLGVAAGAWILSLQWILDSLSCDVPKPEEPYEIQGDVVNGLNHRGPSRSRNRIKNVVEKGILQDFHFIYQGNYSQLTTNDLTTMITLLGGTVEEGSQTKPNQHRIILVQPSANKSSTRDFYIEMARKNNCLVVSREWLLDTVSTYNVRDLVGGYVLGRPDN